MTLPPLAEIGDSFILRRAPGTQQVLCILQNGDSYELDYDSAVLLLKLLNVDETLGWLDYVWNFYAARFFLKELRLEPLTLDQSYAIAARPREHLL